MSEGRWKLWFDLFRAGAGREDKAFLGNKEVTDLSGSHRGEAGRGTGGRGLFWICEQRGGYPGIEWVCGPPFRETSEGLLSTFRKDPGKKVKPLSPLCPSAAGGWGGLPLRPSQLSSDDYTPSARGADRISVTALRLGSCFL